MDEGEMNMRSKLLPFVMVGAVVGAAISMFDRQTREHTIEASKKVKDTVSYYAANTDELQQLIEDKVSQAQSFYSAASENVDILLKQVEDAKALPSTLQSMVMETKDVFFPKEK